MATVASWRSFECIRLSLTRGSEGISVEAQTAINPALERRFDLEENLIPSSALVGEGPTAAEVMKNLKQYPRNANLH